MMKDHQFNYMEEQEQTTAVWEKGVYLAERIEGFHRIKLYQLEDFYVEVCYHTHFNVIIKVNSFSDMDLLDPYLQAININSVFYQD
jgi:hypothetical protein